MSPIEVARKLAGLGSAGDACRAYELALAMVPEPGADEKMEAAMYILQFEGEYRAAYTAFLELYRDGYYKEDAWNIMTEAFYLPNEKQLRSRYENNVKQLKKYPYFFRSDFPAFEDLPICFYPFDDSSYVPYSREEGRFGDTVDPGEPVIRRNFFKDLEDPVLAEDVYSQYELEYLNDNVRPSEYVGRENHIYLHYRSWGEFCSWLQVLSLRRLLTDRKLVFLIEDQISLYPIDFKVRFGIDYSAFPLRPVGVREINRLIWHTQLSYHNGGDFFNEVFDGHPNLIYDSSVLRQDVDRIVDDLRATFEDARSVKEIMEVFDNGEWHNFDMIRELYFMRDRTDKDILVTLFCRSKVLSPKLDPSSRIAPAIFFQPHFEYNNPSVTANEKGQAIISSDQYDYALNSNVFKNFKYIKVFSPIRRITTSYGATARFMWYASQDRALGDLVVADEIVERLLLRGYLVDGEKRLFKDSVAVRFEDAKLNPKATFSSLAAFLDLPYTESMTVCTVYGIPTQAALEQEVYGFDTAAVYRTYDEFCCDAERCWLEYFLRDAYKFYGYDFMYYDGTPVDEARVLDWISHFEKIDYFIRESHRDYFERTGKKEPGPGGGDEGSLHEAALAAVDSYMQSVHERRVSVARVLLKGLEFVNGQGRPLRFMPKLEPDPALLERPLYH